MNNPNYHIATNKAYEILAKFDSLTLPICAKSIIDMYPTITVLSYADACKKYKRKVVDLMVQSHHGFTLKNGSNHIILYNSWMRTEIIRFTLAHELGHCELGHEVDDDINNAEANCFARNLLCPIPAVECLSVKTAADYMAAFFVSKPMAKASISLATCDHYHVNRNLYKKVLDAVV